MVQIRHLFAGSNTAQGFYSLFENIIGHEAKRIYLLKGGPGTGKSRFMKEIAEAVAGEGYDQELFFCSSDSLSLDAVSFPALGVALIDATLPHALEGEWPGCRDQLISLGNFWSSDGLVEKREEIIAKGLVKRGYFASAFRYFAAARAIEENIEARNRGQQVDYSRRVGELFALIDGARPNYATRTGRMRHLFASALTPEGYVSHIKSLTADYPTRHILTGAPGTAKSDNLWRLATYAQGAGLDLEVFHYPLDPKKLLHILIPELQLAVLTAIDLDLMEDLEGEKIDCGLAEQNLKVNAGDYALLKELLQRGIAALRLAQEGHGAVEEYYASQMDFKALDVYRQKILAEILSYKNRS